MKYTSGAGVYYNDLKENLVKSESQKGCFFISCSCQNLQWDIKNIQHLEEDKFGNQNINIMRYANDSFNCRVWKLPANHPRQDGGEEDIIINKTGMVISKKAQIPV